MPAAPRRHGRRSRHPGRSTRSVRLERAGLPRDTTSHRAGRRPHRHAARRDRRPRAARSVRGSSANEPVAARSGGSTDRSGSRWPDFRALPPRPAACVSGARDRPSPSSILDLGVDRRDVEVDGVLVDPRRVTRRELRRRPVRRSAGRGRAGRGAAAGVDSGIAAASWQDAPPARARPADAVSSGGPSTSPGGASRVASASRSWNVLKRLAALLVPSRAHASTPSAAASSSSSRRWTSSGSKRDRTWSRPFRTGSPIPTRRRLNFSVPSSSMTERSPLCPPWLPASRNRSLPNGQREVVCDRRAGRPAAHARARAPCVRPMPGVVHEGQRLDEGEFEPVVPADGHVRGVALPPTPGQAGPLREPVEHEPTDVVTRPGIPLTRITEPDDDLHHPSGQHDRTRIPSDQVRGGDRQVAGGPDEDGTAGRASGRSRRDPGAAVPASRMARLVRAVAWSQPQMCNVPWVTSRRSSSAGDQRTSPVCPPRPASACSIARSTETTMSPRWMRLPGGRGDVGCRAAPGMKDAGGSNGNDSTSVGPVVAHVGDVEVGELGVVGEDQPDRCRRGRSRVVEGSADRCGEAGDRRGRVRPRPAGRRRSATAVDRWLGVTTRPGSRARPVASPCRLCPA